MDVSYFYAGTTFRMRQIGTGRRITGYDVVGLNTYGEAIEIPARINGIPVRAVRFPYPYVNATTYEYQYYGVRTLCIHGDIDLGGLYNLNFPDLEEIDLPTQDCPYLFLGGMLYKNGGSTLVLALRAGMGQESVVVPSAVVEIGPEAFCYTRCRDIIFHNRNVRYTGNPFRESEWVKGCRLQHSSVYVGSMLYRVFSEEELILDPMTKQMDPKVFSESEPQEITVHTLQQLNILFSLSVHNCRKLTIMSDEAIPISLFARWKSLTHVCLPGNSRYIDKRGVVFDASGRTLLYYPSARTDTSFTIPEGTEIIAHHAFAHQKYLEKVTMPSTIRTIEAGAFYACGKLKSIHLPEGLTELPDATDFETEGVFEGCSALREICLPNSLRYIGERSFFGAHALQEVSLPMNLDIIGAYAFYDTGIQMIKFPYSLWRIGKGALAQPGGQGVLKVAAHRGRVKGLFSAIELLDDKGQSARSHISWRELVLVPMAADGSKKDSLWFPASFDAKHGAFLCHLWDEDRLDEKWEGDFFQYLQEDTEKIAYALQFVQREGERRQNDERVFASYLKEKATAIAEQKIKDKDEKGLIAFIKQGFLTEKSIREIQLLCNENGFYTASAYLLSQINQLKADSKAKEDILRI